jgi:hypothetical protein
MFSASFVVVHLQTPTPYLNTTCGVTEGNNNLGANTYPDTTPHDTSISRALSKTHTEVLQTVLLRLAARMQSRGTSHVCRHLS